MGSGRGNSGRILFWSLVLVGLMVLGIGIGLLVGQATVGASIGLGLILIVMVHLREGPARGHFGAVFSLGLSAFFLALGVVQLLGLAKAERVVVDALFIVVSNITFLWWGVLQFWPRLVNPNTFFGTLVLERRLYQLRRGCATSVYVALSFASLSRLSVNFPRKSPPKETETRERYADR